MMIKSIFEMSSASRPVKKPRLSMTLSDGLWQILARTNHALARVRQKELHQYGINMNDAIVLFTVVRLKDAASPTAISRQLFWEPHTVSAQLKTMEKKGLIRRVKDQKRQNLIWVEITEKGLEAYRKSSLHKSTRKMMSALTKEEQLQLWAMLAKIREKTMKELGWDKMEPFPPSDPSDL